MKRWLRIAGWLALVCFALWAALKVIGFVFGVVSWVVSTVVSLVVLAALLYLAYLAVTRFVGGRGGSGRSREGDYERGRIYE